jgi:hypothetical protein
MLLLFLLSLLFSAVIAVFAAAGVRILVLWLRESRPAVVRPAGRARFLTHFTFLSERTDALQPLQMGLAVSRL